MFGNALCTYIVVPITSGFPSWPFSTPVENVQAALRFFTFALLIWVSGLKRCRSDVRPVIVHSPAPWPTAGAATSTIRLAASPPDHSLKRFIADLMLRMRGVKKRPDRKSTRLNSSHGYISYAVFCLKKKKKKYTKSRIADYYCR